MNSITTTSTKDNHLLEDQALRRKRKITSFVFFFILFTIIISSIISVFIALKKEAESESISASNPEQAIKAVCDLSPSPALCFKPICTLHVTSSITGEIKTTPSRIFTLSLRVAFNELFDLISVNQKAISKVKDSRTLTALKGCDVLFRDSISLINMTMTAMGVDPDDKIFKVTNSVPDMKDRISSSTENIEKCLTRLGGDQEGLKAKIGDARGSVENSLVILQKMDKILGMFNLPMFAGIIDYETLLDRLRYDFGMILYCLQYLFLIVLFCMVLRL